MNAGLIFFAYVAVLMAVLTLVVIYYEFRRKRFEPEPSKDHIFRCGKCAFVYTDDADVELSRCPHCGKMNEEIQF